MTKDTVIDIDHQMPSTEPECMKPLYDCWNNSSNLSSIDLSISERQNNLQREHE